MAPDRAPVNLSPEHKNPGARVTGRTAPTPTQTAIEHACGQSGLGWEVYRRRQRRRHPGAEIHDVNVLNLAAPPEVGAGVSHPPLQSGAPRTRRGPARDPVSPVGRSTLTVRASVRNAPFKRAGDVAHGRTPRDVNHRGTRPRRTCPVPSESCSGTVGCLWDHSRVLRGASERAGDMGDAN
jgi:hypothetical protein